MGNVGKYSIKTFWAVLFAFLGYTLVSCGSGNKFNPMGPSAVSPLTVSPATATVAIGSTQTFSASGGTPTYAWSVSNKAVATINAVTGVLTGVSAGTVTVTATDAGGRVSTATATIGASSSSASSIVISPDLGQVAQGGSLTYTATGGTSPYFWSVSNSALGTIGISSGVFMASSTGTGSVKVTDSKGNTSSATVTITTSNLVLTPSTLALTAPPQQSIIFLVSGIVFSSTTNNTTGGAYWSITGATNGYSGATISPSCLGGVITETTGTCTQLSGNVKVTTWPTSAQGTQELTVNVTVGNNQYATAALTLAP